MISLVSNIYQNKYNFNDTLNNIHNHIPIYPTHIPTFGKNDRELYLIRDFYDEYDNNSKFEESYKSLIQEKVKPIFDNEKLIVQKTPNIRFHLPNCSNIGKRDTDPSPDVIGLHNDSEFGHPEEEVNFIYAITDMYDTNTLYYEQQENSDIEPYNYNNLKLNSDDLWHNKLNKLRHYNKINKTGKTRVSLDFRVIPYSKYKPSTNISATSKNKFIVGDYYMII